MVYYNRMLKVWIVDQIDIFLISALCGSILAEILKYYLYEKKAMNKEEKAMNKEKKSMEKLKRCIIRKSETPPAPCIFSSKDKKIQQIYKCAVQSRGGDNKAILKLSEKIKTVVEQLAKFLKERELKTRELKGFSRIFYKNASLLLELLLYRFKIYITYTLQCQELNQNYQVVIATSTLGGGSGFIISWCSLGITLFAPTLIFGILSVRGLGQQIFDQNSYSNFKKMFDRMLKDDEIKDELKTKVKALFIEELPNEKFIKGEIERQFGLIENPTPEEIKSIMSRRIHNEKGMRLLKWDEKLGD